MHLLHNENCNFLAERISFMLAHVITFRSYKVARFFQCRVQAGAIGALIFVASGLHPCLGAVTAEASWKRGDWTNDAFFPIAVWLQAPANAERYKQAGINTYIGLWKGPTRGQLDALRKAGMRVICEQNDVGLTYPDRELIVAWMHGDEPDNAQPLGDGKGWGPPVPPEAIVRDYRKLRERDPSRPVLLNLGQGVAWDNWYGRGVRSRHPEDYPLYIEGCDVVSFDIYPAVHDKPEVAGKLWYVARGVERLVKWTDGKKGVWNCLECTRISNENVKPTPTPVRAEAWMSIIHGSRGLIYFVHQFKPVFREAALLDDVEMLREVTRLNHQIQDLAPVINSPPTPTIARVQPADTNAPIALMTRCQGKETYVFTVEMRDQPTGAQFTVPGLSGEHKVEVIGESRTLTAKDGTFADSFAAWEVHLYRLSQ
jgi:hypothetical protein